MDKAFLELLTENNVPFFFLKARIWKEKLLYIIFLPKHLYLHLFKSIFKYCALPCNDCIHATFENSKYSIIFKQHLFCQDFQQFFYLIFDSSFKNIASFLKWHPFDYGKTVYLVKDNVVFGYHLANFKTVFKKLKRKNFFYF